MTGPRNRETLIERLTHYADSRVGTGPELAREAAAALAETEEALQRAVERLTDKYGDWDFADELVRAAVPEENQR